MSSSTVVQVTEGVGKPRSSEPRFRRFVLTRQERVAVLFLSPLMLLFIVFLIVPMTAGFTLAFQQWSVGGVEPNKWIGLGNYTRMVQTPRFWNSMRVTLTYAAGLVIIPYLVALPLALFLNMKIPGRGAFRTLFFLPAVTPITAAGMVFIFLFNTEFGVINYFLLSLNLISEPVSWLGRGETAIPASMALIVWGQAGFNAVTLLAGLQIITQEILDAAAIDGAHGWSLFRYITLPMLKPASVVVITFSLINSFKLFGEIFVMTQGGPALSTEVLGLYLYENAFHYWQLGYATAVGSVIAVIAFIVNYIMSKIGRVDWQ
ncbi:sugar ABC transporter permease [Chloroflexi bacterium TSY]|nr:sugar ABC transporter permease [Chloroflexi bacterium TSY]